MALPAMLTHSVLPLHYLADVEPASSAVSQSGGGELLSLPSLPAQLAVIGFILIFSIIVDRYALKIGVPGALALFVVGVLLQPTAQTGFSHKSFEHLHIVALCLLLFYSGVKICRRYFRRREFLLPSLLLSSLGVLLFIGVGGLVVYTLLSATIPGFAGSQQPLLIAVALTYSIAPQDWGAYSFVVKRVNRFSDRIRGVLEFEASISAAMTLVIGEALFQLFSDSATTTMASRAAEIFINGVSGGIVIGAVLGYLLAACIKRFAVERSQSIDLAVGFVMIGYGFNTWLGDGGLICSLVMGMVVSILLSTSDTEDEKEMLSLQLESINIATEALIFFMAGLAVDLSVNLRFALIGSICLLIVVWIFRPLMVALFFRGEPKFLQANEIKFLSLWSPKGAISMGFAITIPDLIEQAGIPFERVINPVSESYIIDVVCLTVVLTMILKSLVLPIFHNRFLKLNEAEVV